MTITPLRNQVLIKPHYPEEEQAQKSGIIIAQTSDKDRPRRGIVVKLGPDVRHKELKAGHLVYFEKYGPVPFTDDSGEEYVIVPDRDIMAFMPKGSVK